MIEGLIDFCCRNKFLVILAFVGIAAGGIWVLERTPVDASPDLSENQVIVFTDWMGRSPKEIEDQITYPLSVNLQGLAGVKAVRSSSEFNFSMINIIFDDSVEFYFARTRVLERLSLASTFLPQGTVPYLAPDATALGQIFWYTVEGDNTISLPVSRTGTCAISSIRYPAWPKSAVSAAFRRNTNRRDREARAFNVTWARSTRLSQEQHAVGVAWSRRATPSTSFAAWAGYAI